jgi:hypothetical protein
LSERHLNLHSVKAIVFRIVRFAGRTPFARLPLRRQPTLDAAALRVRPTLGLRALDDFFSSSTRTTMWRMTWSITLRRRSSSFISSPDPLITSRT